MTSTLLGTATSVLLVVAVVLLASMVPGGPVETRSFGHLHGAVFWGFNVFLISLGLASFVLAGFSLGAHRWTFAAAAVVGLLYVGVFVLDLGRVFPKTPDRMPSTLLLLEIVDTAVAGGLVVVAIQGWLQ